MFIEIPKGTNKSATYDIMLNHLENFIVHDDALLTTLSNLSAYINYFLDDINWVGFYLFDGEKLFLGPFQGLPACTIIQLGSGVCGTSAQTKKSIIVHDVNAFEGHIACDSNSASEIVVPLLRNNTLLGVLDVDSPHVSRFDQVDKKYLEKLIEKLVDIAF